MQQANQNENVRPTWEFATRIYIEVLKNPKSSASSIAGATEDLIRLAQYVDAKSGRK
jgi:hypothetical protein